MLETDKADCCIQKVIVTGTESGFAMNNIAPYLARGLY